MAGGGARAPEGVWDRIAGSLDEQVPALRLTTDELDAARRTRLAPTDGDVDHRPPTDLVGDTNVVAFSSGGRAAR